MKGDTGARQLKAAKGLRSKSEANSPAIRRQAENRAEPTQQALNTKSIAERRRRLRMSSE